MKLDIKKEKEKLSTKYKKLWVIKEKLIDKMYQDGEINTEEKESMIQTQMALIRTTDLEEQNEYNRKSNDIFAKRAIKKNEAEISKMERFYNDNAKIIGQSKVDKIEEKLDNRAAKEIEKLNEQNKNKGRK